MATNNDEDLVGQLEDVRAALYALLRTRRPESLAVKPPSGDWSVVENVRHLIYAEQKHLGRLLPGRLNWSPIGLPSGGGTRRTGVGTQPSDDIAEVLAAWDAVHGPIREALRNPDDPERAEAALRGHLGHLRAHVRTINGLLDDRRAGPDKPAGRRRRAPA